MRPTEASGAGTLPVRIVLFGPPQVVSADGGRRFPLPRRTLDVLAYLILNRGRTLPRASVAYALFPDEDEETARGSLRRNLSYLISSLPATSAANAFIVADTETLAWNAGAPARIDIEEFQQALRDGRDDDAIALYSGELLPTLYDEWPAPERERLRTEFHDALERVMQRDRSRRRFDQASTAARRLLNEDPWREDIVREFMAIQYESGDRGSALSEFERFATRLRAEMQAEPMPETVALREAILRGDRLSTSEAVLPRTGSPAAPAPGLPLVGREAAIASAQECWHAAADGRAGILFVAGEAGVGKSRLATELARLIEREGGFAVRGETSAGGEHHPYEAFINAIRSAAPRRLEQLQNEYDAVTLTDDRAARVRLFESVRRSIAELAHARPVAVVLEDLHWAGPDTVDLLDFVTRRLGNAPVLLVVTMRTDELARTHPLRNVLRQLQTRDTSKIITLQRLSPDEAERALRTATPSHVSDDAIARAVAWADGVPLLLAEALRDLAAGRAVSQGDITALVGERFTRLSPEGETALVYAALLGARFDLATLAAATGWSDDALIRALGESMELGIVRASTSVPGIGYTFTHHLLLAAARERIGPDDRGRAHALIARVLCDLPNSRGSRAAEIARHFEAAGERALAAEYLLHAARYALNVFANDDARESATDGLALAGANDELRYELLAAREIALRRLGATTERRADALALVECAPEGTERASEALELVADSHDVGGPEFLDALQRLERLAALSERQAAIFERVDARHAYASGNFPRAREAAFSAAERFRRLGDERAALFANLRGVLALGRMGAYAEVTAAIERLRPVVEASGDLAAAAEFYRVASSAASDEQRETTLADARRSLELSLRVGDRYAEARARQNVGYLLGKLRRYGESIEELELSLSAFREVADVVGIRAMLLNLVSSRERSGDIPRARMLFDELQDDAPREKWDVVRSSVLRGLIELREGRFTKAADTFTAARNEAVMLAAPLLIARCDAFLGEVFAFQGKSAAAITVLRAALERLADLGQPGISAEIQAMLAVLHAGSNDAGAARAAAEAAQAIITQTRVQDYSRISWHLAATYALLDERDVARRWAEDAARAFVEDALSMDADLAESYSRLPWHHYAIAYLAGRDVPLRIGP